MILYDKCLINKMNLLELLLCNENGELIAHRLIIITRCAWRKFVGPGKIQIRLLLERSVQVNLGQLEAAAKRHHLSKTQFRSARHTILLLAPHS